MTLAVFPTRRVRSLDERVLVYAQGSTRSPFDATSQIQDWGGVWWRYGVTCAVIKGRGARELAAFFVSLRGRANPFLFEDPGMSLAVPDVGVLHRSPVVAGSDQSGRELNSVGWDRSTLALRTGDFLSLGSDASTRLYAVTQDAIADASGAASIMIEPPLRSSPLDGDLIEVDRPKVALRMVTPVPTSIAPADRYTFRFTAEEAL